MARGAPRREANDVVPALDDGRVLGRDDVRVGRVEREMLPRADVHSAADDADEQHASEHEEDLPNHGERSEGGTGDSNLLRPLRNGR